MKKLFAVVLMLSLIALAFCSCGKSSGSNSLKESYESPSDGTYPPESGKSDIPDAAPSEGFEKKIIKKYSLVLESLEYDKASANVKSLVLSFGGYIETSSESNASIKSASQYARCGTFTLRVPAEKLDSFIESVSSDCNVLTSDLTTDDVTDSYYGLADTLESLVVQRDRILAMMEKTDDIKDLITLDDKLTEITTRINSINRAIVGYDKSVDYSYFYLALNEVNKYQPVKEPTFAERIGSAVTDAFDTFFTFLGNVFIGILWVIPFLIIPAVILVIVFVVERKKKLRKEKNKAENKQN